MVIKTARLTLRPLLPDDSQAFAALHSDPEVMRDYGAPLTRYQSDEKLARYRAAYDRYGFTRWALDDTQGQFLGYVGVMPIPEAFPVAPGFDIGWRLIRAAWGAGLATEAAIAALADVFARTRLNEVLAYTSQDNIRSQAVIRKLSLRRDPARDFTNLSDSEPWDALVWVACRPGSN